MDRFNICLVYPAMQSDLRVLCDPVSEYRENSHCCCTARYRHFSPCSSTKWIISALNRLKIFKKSFQFKDVLILISVSVFSRDSLYSVSGPKSEPEQRILSELKRLGQMSALLKRLGQINRTEQLVSGHKILILYLYRKQTKNQSIQKTRDPI